LRYSTDPWQENAVAVAMATCNCQRLLKNTAKNVNFDSVAQWTQWTVDGQQWTATVILFVKEIGSTPREDWGKTGQER